MTLPANLDFAHVEIALMNYRMRRQGEDLGVFTLEELRRRHECGELTGGEYIQGEGMPDWQPLDLVLQQGYRVAPPPLPSSVSKGGPNQGVIWLIITVGVILFVTFFAYVGINFQRGFQNAVNSNRSRRRLNQSSQEGVAAAGKPVTWTTNTLTALDVQKWAREFRIRQWLEGYEKRGRRNPACDAEAEQFIRIYIARNYGGLEATNTLSLEAESDRLAQNPDCTDPLVLTVAADNNIEVFAAIHLFERALDAFPESHHKAYPQLYASVGITRFLSDHPERITALDASSLKLLGSCFTDGSFLPGDQQEIGEIFINGWGSGFFERNAVAICQITHEAGPAYQWLALTLDGERQINEAWKARGDGYSNTVTKEGWKGFNNHLAEARTTLTQAWNLQPGFPLAPCRMMTVALGDSGADEMRLWFDRTVSAQLDYPQAWSGMRWGLRPRWYGSENAVLALGRTAVNTGRFDTDVPRKFFDCISDVESEMELPSGRHIYGRADIWPELQKMYQGYISEQSQSPYRSGWRSGYAIVAYFAGKYDVAAEQLKALDWKLQPKNLTGWRTDLSLMPLEVAARTGPLGKSIIAAESSYQSGDVATALRQFTDLRAATNVDARTLEFVQTRLASLAMEQRLQKGEWVDFMPSQNDDPGWVCSRGKIQRLPDGALEVRSGPAGHFIFSRARVGSNFEIRGEFEVVHSSTKYFQAGLVMGTPDVDAYEFQGFRIKRHQEEGDIACFAQGWGARQIQQRAKVNDIHNSFDFRLDQGHITASVNGEEVFKDAIPKDTLDMPGQDYPRGLGRIQRFQRHCHPLPQRSNSEAGDNSLLKIVRPHAIVAFVPGFPRAPVKHVHHVAKILLVGHAVGGLGGKFHLGAEVTRQFAEQFHPGRRIKFLAPQQRLQGDVRLRRGDPLAQAGRQMRILPERVVFAGEQLVEVGLGHARIADDHGVGGDVAQPLASGVEPAGQPADKIKRRQRIHKPQQVAHDDLVELQPHPFHVHHAQAEQPLADGLAAPGPFQEQFHSRC